MREKFAGWIGIIFLLGIKMSGVNMVVFHGEDLYQFSVKTEGRACQVMTKTSVFMGLCVNIKECDVLFRKLDEVERRPEIKQFLQNLRCDKENVAYVCCPPKSVMNPKKQSEDEYPHILSPPQCGQVDVAHHKVVGGEVVHEGAMPWMASLWYMNVQASKSETFCLCGGSLISENHVLTAAHCLRVRKHFLFAVGVGGHDINNRTDGLYYSIERLIVHPDFSKKDKLNDIGLIKLKNKVQFAWNIKPICLPKMKEMQSESFSRHIGLVAGWGVSSAGQSKLLQALIPILDNEFCNRTIHSRLNYEINSKQICAYDEINHRDTCQGDSGGPLIVPLINAYYIVGVVSIGYKCGVPGYPGIYTRVTSYIDWISSVIK